MSEWPIGYCERDTHRGTEHGLYMSSDGGCVNFVPSWRLLEIKQLFDAAALLAKREGEIEALRETLKRIKFCPFKSKCGDCARDIEAALSDNPESPALTDKEA